MSLFIRGHCSPLQLRTTARFALRILSRRSGEDLPHASRVLVDELGVGGRLLRPGGVERGRVLKRIFKKACSRSAMNVVDFVTWSTRCVYFVRDDRPKFFTCITFGSTWWKGGIRRDRFVSKSFKIRRLTVLSNLSSRVAPVVSLFSTSSSLSR